MHKKKRGFFFTLDAVMALTVIGIGFFLVLTAYLFVPPRSQTEAIAQSALQFLSTTAIENLNDPYAGIGGELWESGKISQRDNTLLQQIAHFEAKGDRETAELFVDAILDEIVPMNYGFQIKVNGNSLYPLVESSELIASKQETDLLIAREIVVYGVLNTTTFEIWGPSAVQIMVWHE
ncbi:MAG TPA: hypothetical protein VJB12_02535 [Candidatus Nanoarchaeia archaeon]|nr:hypothetical protein [Candidatus Nanoarchaeia archaeon]